MSKSLILVGPMGAGKTTIGRIVSQEIHLPFKDIDQLVVEKAGADIPWIFDVEGEDGFRKREHQALVEALSGEASVIATGGGIIVSEDNRMLLKKAGGVVFLYASIDHQFLRAGKDKNRPLLQKGNPQQTLERLMTQREPFYREVSDIVLKTDSSKPKTLVNSIVEYWKSIQ